MRFVNAVLILALIPTPVLAQGGYGGYPGRRGGGDFGRVGQRQGLPTFATAKELEKFNAADALIQEQRKLKLTEAQMKDVKKYRAGVGPPAGSPVAARPALSEESESTAQTNAARGFPDVGMFEVVADDFEVHAAEQSVSHGATLDHSVVLGLGITGLLQFRH